MQRQDLRLVVGLLFGLVTVVAAACGIVSGSDDAADVGGITQTIAPTSLAATSTTAVVVAPAQTVPEQLGLEDPPPVLDGQSQQPQVTAANNDPTWYVTTTSTSPPPNPEIGNAGGATTTAVILADPLDNPAAVPLDTTAPTAAPPVGARPVADATLAEVQVLDTFPVEVKLKIVGSRPGPCHRLAIDGPTFLPDDRIDLRVTTTPGETQCADDPQSFGRLVSLGQIDPGTYRVLVNDQPFVFTID